MSHRFKKNSIHFHKTMNDILLMRKNGGVITEDLWDIFVKREKETYNYNHPKLNVSKENFFKDDNILYKYDHDSIHTTLSILVKPAYTYFLKEGSEVLTSKEKFFNVDENVRLYAVLEESLVLALERSLIPYNFEPDPEKMFLFALNKVCTSITSGYFRQYAYDNYHKVIEIFKSYNKSNWYVEKFKEGLNKGLVLPFKGNIY